MADELLPCRCGADARMRHKDPYVWVECRKKCGVHTRYLFEYTSAERRKNEQRVIREWNGLVSDDGRTKHIHQD